MDKKWTLERLTRRERKRVLDYLRKVSAPDAAQIRLQDDLRSAQGDHIVERMLLEGSNLVCGSTIGILQHPDIKKGDQATPSFDMLIVDEASKTTFQEFLVPALLAKRWVLVGDPKQLSPFVDDDGVAAALDDCLPDEDRRNACIDTFLAMTGTRGAAAVVANAKQEEIWREEAAHRGVAIRAPADADAALADIVVGSEASLDARPQALRIDFEIRLRILDRVNYGGCMPRMPTLILKYYQCLTAAHFRGAGRCWLRQRLRTCRKTQDARRKTQDARRRRSASAP